MAVPRGATNTGRDVANVLYRAERMRASGRWSEWRWRDVPNGVPGGESWCKEFRRLAENGIFAVLVRETVTAWGPVLHASISCVDVYNPPSWAEKQRIKNTLFGRERLAIEVFPPESQLVDGASTYHLWVLPQGFEIPFGLHGMDQQ